MVNRHPCRICGGPKEAHFPPDKNWPRGVCMCGMPDSPCGCPGFRTKRRKTPSPYDASAHGLRRLLGLS